MLRGESRPCVTIAALPAITPYAPQNAEFDPRVYIPPPLWYCMTSNTSSWERVPRNSFRLRRRSGRTRRHPVESMTPQGQALWASKNVGNAYMFMGPMERPRNWKEDE